MADELRQMADVVAFLASYDGQKLSVVVTCGEGTGKDARQLLTRNLAQINGRGGGDARLAQEIGVVTAEQHRIFLNNIETD
jgi:alanyl-tRNA synthetase